MHLLLRMRPLVDLADAALEDVGVVHVQHQGDGVVLGTWDVTEADLFVVLLVVVADHHRIGVVTVVGLAHQFHFRPDLQLVPNLVGFVLHSSRQMAVHEILLFCFHNFVGFRV